jgi:PAS domain S-box-containing protein
MHDQTDLQASQHIIDLFENSKAQSDEVLDSLPGIYCIITSQGLILKGNKTLAEIFNVGLEDLLGKEIKNLFPEAHGRAFQAQVDKLFSEKAGGSELRADVVTDKGAVRNYLWSVNPLSTERNEVADLVSVLGRDVTELTEATVQKTKMQGELATARTVQERLFLEPNAQFKKISLSGFYEPANECGGDWWHYGMINGKLFLWIGDVTGHGVPAALVVSAVNSAVSLIGSDDLTPAKALSILNNVVFATAKNQLAMTFFVGSIDLNTLECVYSSAAHEPVLLLPADKTSYSVRDLKVLEADPGYPLGLSEKSEYKEQSIQLSAGDRLLLYTDGLREVVNPEGRKWKNLEFLRTLVPLASEFRGSQDLVVKMKEKIEEYRQGAPLGDDTTLVAVSL